MKDTIYVKADVYANNREKYDRLANLCGQKICTVDLQAGYVAPKVDKWGQDPEVGAYTQQNIHERFALETPNDGDDFSDENYSPRSNAGDSLMKSEHR